MSTKTLEELNEQITQLQQAADAGLPQQLAEKIFTLLSEKDTRGNSHMHRYWQHSRFMGPGAMDDQLGTFIATLDKMLGTVIAVDLTTRLLSLQNDAGEMPLDYIRQEEQGSYQKNYIDSFLSNLRKHLGSKTAFETYVREAVAGFLPDDFTIELSTYEPLPEGKRGPRGGAKIKP